MAEPRRLSSLAASVLARARPLPDGPCVVALSGGADSAVCAWAMLASGISARAIFVHHALPASNALRRSAIAIAEKLGLPLEIVEAPVPAGPSWEAEARGARYEGLERSLTEGEWLVTGHTADDQAETVLANLIRGAGLGGLAGVPRIRGRIVRPLLDVWRRETRELGALLDLPWLDDPDNADQRTPRNALRLSLIPAVEELHNPGFREALVRLAARAAEDDALLEERASRVPIALESSEVRVAAAALETLPVPVAARVARRALRLAHPPYPGSEADVRRVLAVASGEAADASVGGGWMVHREGPWLVLVRSPDEPGIPPPVAWDLAGELRFGTWLIEGWIEERPPDAFPLSGWSAILDADAVPSRVHVRAGGPGDTIAIDSGHKSVRKALAEAGVPSRERRGWPVVIADGDVLWVPGVRSSQADWVTIRTRRYLWLRAERRAGE